MKKIHFTRIFLLFSISLLLVLSNILLPLNSVIAATNKVKLKEAPLNQKFVNAQSNKSVLIDSKQKKSKYSLGHIEAPFKLPSTKVNNLKQKTTFPSTYDLRTTGKLTPVRDQLTSNSCWAFASIASVESSLLTAENRDFSENNLKNNHGFDPDANNDGGNLSMSTAYAARWAGIIDESDDKYNPVATKSPTTLPVQKHVQDVLWIPDRTSYLANDSIKDAVMKYGAVYTSMYWEDSNYNSTYSTSYNAFPWKDKYGNNHAVNIVGWDDNFDRNKFYDPYYNKIPPANGAFIVRNSWGTTFGEAGYFYISYYDENVGAENGVFDGIEQTANYNTNYQYDPLGCVDSVGYDTDTAWYSNVFTASSSEDISAVAFYTLASNTSYEVYVCSNYKSTNDLVSSRVLKDSGIISIPGFHTINFNAGTPVAAGEKFAVIVKATTPNYTYPIPVEKKVAGYSSGATATAGQSYVSDLGSSWDDLTSEYNTTSNVCLKAFTKVVTDPPPTEQSVTGVSLDKTSVSLKVGETTSLIATIKPSGATNNDVIWTSDNTSVATVDSTGKVTAKCYGTAIIKVKTADGGYTASCTLLIYTTASKAIGDFVSRFYELCLDRPADSTGLQFWKDKLLYKDCTGADVAKNFIFSPEFVIKNVSDDVFIDIMYKSFFDRAGDSGGKGYWMDKLTNGISRLYVLSLFVNSTEFSTVCNNYGIYRGNIQLTKPADLYPEVTAFIYRFYDKCLGRKPDDTGLNYWVNKLVTGQSTGADISQGFVLSPEFIAKDLSNTDFTTIMYRVFFNREPDSAGLTYWVNTLQSGKTRFDVLIGFVNSKEFATICSKYGIKVGVVKN